MLAFDDAHLEARRREPGPRSARPPRSARHDGLRMSSGCGVTGRNRSMCSHARPRGPRGRGRRRSCSGRSSARSTCSGGRKQTALFTVVEPPTQLPWRTVKLKSSVCCITPSAYSLPIIPTSLSSKRPRLDVATALEHEHVEAVLRQLVGDDGAAGAAADDADVRVERSVALRDARPSGRAACAACASSGLPGLEAAVADRVVGPRVVVVAGEGELLADADARPQHVLRDRRPARQLPEVLLEEGAPVAGLELRQRHAAARERRQPAFRTGPAGRSSAGARSSPGGRPRRCRPRRAA